MLFCPESPIFLIKDGKDDEAAKIIQTMEKKDESEIRKKISQVKKRLFRSKNEGEESNIFQQILSTLHRPEVWKPLLILLSLHFVQQFAGMSIMRTYIIDIFDDIFKHQKNVTNNSIEFLPNVNQTSILKPEQCRGEYQAYLTAVILGVVKTIASFFSPCFVDDHRRRRIYLFSGNYNALQKKKSISLHGTVLNGFLKSLKFTLKSYNFQGNSFKI